MYLPFQWEERLRTDFARLKSELEKMHDDEKVSALSAIKQEMEHKLQTTKNDLEDKLRDSLNEVSVIYCNRLCSVSNDENNFFNAKLGTILCSLTLLYLSISKCYLH